MSTESFAQSNETKSQKSKSKSHAVGIASAIKDTGSLEEVPPPPPPPQEFIIKEVVIDTTSAFSVRSSGRGLTEIPDTAAAPNDELTRELRKMINLTGAIDFGLLQADNSADMLRQMEDELPDGFVDRFLEELRSENFKRLFENVIINIYRKHLTLSDAKEIVRFYESEVGKKVLSTMPAVYEQSKKAGELLGAAIGERIYDELTREKK